MSFSEYNTLGNYNSYGTPAGRGIHPPVPAGTPSMAIQVIPVYGAPGYETLSHDNRLSAGGHFTIQNAYPNYANNCDKFAQRLCAGPFVPTPPEGGSKEGFARNALTRNPYATRGSLKYIRNQ